MISTRTRYASPVDVTMTRTQARLLIGLLSQTTKGKSKRDPQAMSFRKLRRAVLDAYFGGRK